MQQAPQFSLYNQDNTLCSLEQFKGEWIILYFYPKDETPGCTKEACDFAAFQKERPIILGVSPDSTDSHQAFYQKHSLTFDLLSDPSKEVLKAYGAWGVKKNYGKEYEGVIRSTFLINPEGLIAASWKNVRVNGHAEKVLTKWKALNAETLK